MNLWPPDNPPMHSYFDAPVIEERLFGCPEEDCDYTVYLYFEHGEPVDGIPNCKYHESIGLEEV